MSTATQRKETMPSGIAFSHLNECKNIPIRDLTPRKLYLSFHDRFATACGIAMSGLLPVPFAVDLLPPKGKPSFLNRMKGVFRKHNKIEAAWGFDFGHACFKAVRLTFDTDGTLAVDECFHCNHADYDPKSREAETKSVFSDEEEAKLIAQLNEPIPPNNPFAPNDDLKYEAKIHTEDFKRYALEIFLSKYQYRGEAICVGYAPHDIFCDNVRLPQMTPNQTWSAVQIEMKRKLADGISSFAYNYLVLGWEEDENNLLHQYLNLFATRNSTVEKTINLLYDYGIDPTHIMPTIYANLNYAIELLGLPPVDQVSTQIGNPGDNGTTKILRNENAEYQLPEIKSILVCDMGTAGTDLVLYTLQEIKHYYIPIGGRDFTRSIANGLGCSPVQAEAIKRDFSRADDLPKLAETLKPVGRKFVDEIILRLKHFRKSGGTFDKVIVLGGGFQLKGFAGYFKSLLEALWKEGKG